jgi:hypothetical protein
MLHPKIGVACRATVRFERAPRTRANRVNCLDRMSDDIGVNRALRHVGVRSWCEIVLAMG